jgi:hypothetical protein
MKLKITKEVDSSELTVDELLDILYDDVLFYTGQGNTVAIEKFKNLTTELKARFARKFYDSVAVRLDSNHPCVLTEAEIDYMVEQTRASSGSQHE